MTSPFDDIRALVASAPPFDATSAATVRRPGLGKLDEAVAWVAGIQGRPEPSAERALVCLFVSAQHGGSSAASARARLTAFTAGGAPINAICAAGGLGFRAFDLAADLPSADIALEPAMSERDCVATMAFGMEAVAGGADLLALGDGSPGGEAGAAALLAALGRDPPARWAGPHDINRVTAALLRHGPDVRDPLAAVASFGGREVAALVGAILAARHGRVPVLLDGWPALAAATALHAIDPASVAHCRPGHLPLRLAAAPLLDRLGMAPVLAGLDLPRGEGTGAALALGPLRAAIACAAARG